MSSLAAGEQRTFRIMGFLAILAVILIVAAVRTTIRSDQLVYKSAIFEHSRTRTLIIFPKSTPTVYFHLLSTIKVDPSTKH
jgi:hypothetical protein